MKRLPFHEGHLSARVVRGDAPGCQLIDSQDVQDLVAEPGGHIDDAASSVGLHDRLEVRAMHHLRTPGDDVGMGPMLGDVANPPADQSHVLDVAGKRIDVRVDLAHQAGRLWMVDGHAGLLESEPLCELRVGACGRLEVAGSQREDSLGDAESNIAIRMGAPELTGLTARFGTQLMTAFMTLDLSWNFASRTLEHTGRAHRLHRLTIARIARTAPSVHDTVCRRSDPNEVGPRSRSARGRRPSKPSPSCVIREPIDVFNVT